METNSPQVAQYGSYKTQVEKDKSYFICSCGYSKTQPFCDGSHKDTTFKPIRYTATKDGIVGFCGCKHSANMPRCDGVHRDLSNPSQS